jgi:hypothetical protein
MIARFGGTDRDDVARRLTQTLLLRDDPGVDRERTARLVTLALEKSPPPPTSIVQFVVAGWLDYREGRFAACVQRLSGLSWPKNLRLEAQRNLILAMAYQRLGKADEAHKHLDAAYATAAQAPGDPDGKGTGNPAWTMWLRYEILRREAEGVILDPGFPDDPFAY